MGFIIACVFILNACICIGIVSCGSSGYKGCAFEIPYQLVVNSEPEGSPMKIGIDLLIIGLRDISGGSFGTDVE